MKQIPEEKCEIKYLGRLSVFNHLGSKKSLI